MNAHTEIQAETKVRRLTVDISDLRAALGWVNKVRENRTTIPILGQNLFQIAGDRLTMIATCLDREAKATIPCEASGDWSCVVNGHRIVKVIDGLSGSVTIEHDQAADQIALRADGMSLAANVMAPPEDWPHFDQRKSLGSIEVGENTLLRALRLVKPCISTEETRYYLNGIFWTSHDNGSRMVTTNGHRLARLDLDAPKPPYDTILPRIGIAPLSAMLTANGNQSVKVSYIGMDETPMAMRFELGDRTLTCKLIDGTYPDYSRVIPSLSMEPKFDAVITNSVAQRLRRMSDFHTPGCKISPANGTITIGNSSRDGMLSVTYAAQPKPGPDVGFNVHYLAEATKMMGDIRIRSLGKADPALVTSEELTDLTMAIMPMRV